MKHHTKPALRARNLAVAVGLGAALTLSACSDDDDGPTRDDEGTVTETQEATAFDIEVGDCILEPDGETEIFDVDFVPCDEPHDAEAYHAFDLEDGDFPGSAAIQDAVADECFPAFEEFVDFEWETSELDFSWMEPTAGSWADGDREVICLVFEYSGEQKTGSAEGAGR